MDSEMYSFSCVHADGASTTVNFTVSEGGLTFEGYLALVCRAALAFGWTGGTIAKTLPMRDDYEEALYECGGG